MCCSTCATICVDPLRALTQVMGPKLADITSGVLQRLFTKAEEMVRRSWGLHHALRLGTTNRLLPPCLMWS